MCDFSYTQLVLVTSLKKTKISPASLCAVVPNAADSWMEVLCATEFIQSLLERLWTSWRTGGYKLIPQQQWDQWNESRQCSAWTAGVHFLHFTVCAHVFICSMWLPPGFSDSNRPTRPVWSLCNSGSWIIVQVWIGWINWLSVTVTLLLVLY